MPARPPDRRSGLLSRRTVLAGGAGMMLLTACGGGHAKASGGSGDALLPLFDGEGALVPGTPQRLAFAIGDHNGALITDGPATLKMTITPPHGPALAPQVVARHVKGLPRAYYPITFTPATSGSYEMLAEGGGLKLTSVFGIGSRSTVKTVGAGDVMPVVDTPTLSNHRGVDPICTHVPGCPLHQVNLRDALAQHRPTALLIATPAYCQTAICGPVLDVFLAQQKAFGGITFIHAEVYASGADAAENGADAKLAPILAALEITFEPALFLIKPDGTVARRVDVIFDQLELRQVLQDLQG